MQNDFSSVYISMRTCSALAAETGVLVSSSERHVRVHRAGTIWVNVHGPVDANMPFGGFKHSGLGREHGRVGIEMYTELKSVCMFV